MDNKTRTRHTLISIILLIILFAPPALILSQHYTAGSGFLAMIYFGQNFQKTALPDVKEISPVTSSTWGYDGQFYAQLALHPDLKDPNLANALDNPVYRARRIGLSLLAFCLGLGKPTWILQIYALLNFFFWLVLLLAIYHFVGLKKPRDWLLAFALLWSTGTLVSVARSLPDLPATVLGVLALFSNNNWIMAATLLGISGLFKETSVLSFTAIPWSNGPIKSNIKRLVISVMILILPIALWLIYVHMRMPSGSAMGTNNFNYPLFGIIHKLGGSVSELAIGVGHISFYDQAVLISEIICALSLTVQAIYLFTIPELSSATWRFGIGFAILFTLLGDNVWVNQYAYCRVLLPLTFSFNLMIHEYEKDYKYWIWYLLGNGGMCGMLIYSLL